MITYKNYTYKADYIFEDQEANKIYHYAVKSGNEVITLNYSQRREMNEESFKALVDLNFPKSTSGMPFTPSSLKELKYTNEYTIINNRLTYL